MWKQPKPLEPSIVSRTLLRPIHHTVQWTQMYIDFITTMTKVCALMSPKERSIQAHGFIPSLFGSGRWAECQDSRSMWERHSAPHIIEGRSQRKWKTHWELGIPWKACLRWPAFSNYAYLLNSPETSKEVPPVGDQHMSLWENTFTNNNAIIDTRSKRAARWYYSLGEKPEEPLRRIMVKRHLPWYGCYFKKWWSTEKFDPIGSYQKR